MNKEETHQLNLTEFTQYFCIELSKAIKDTGRAEPIQVPKNNILLEAASVQFYGKNIGNVIYTAEYHKLWKKGLPMEELIRDIKENLLDMDGIQFDISSINRENAQAHLRAAIVSYENNKEWLKDIPFERVQDLAVFARWTAAADASIKVNNQMLGQLHMTKEEVLKIAKTNTLESMNLKSMKEVMAEIMRQDGMSEEMIEGFFTTMAVDPKQYVLSVQSGIDGAALIAVPGALKRAFEELGESFYILPSSIHEAILLLKSEFPGGAAELSEIVRSINASEVPVETRLSDNVYEFDGHSLKMAGTEGLTHDTGIADTCSHRRARG